MIVQVDSDATVQSTEAQAKQVAEYVSRNLGRYQNQVGKLVVKLSVVEGALMGSDKRCAIDAQLNNVPALTLTHEGATLEDAINGATTKLEQALAYHFPS